MFVIILSTYHVFGQEGISSGARQLERMMGDKDANFFTVKAYADDYFNTHPPLVGEDGVHEEYERWENFWVDRISYKGANAGSLKDANERYARGIIGGDPSITSIYPIQPICPTGSNYQAEWKVVGPVSFPQQWLGKVQSVLVDESDATHNTVYIGAPTGGIFKTTNFMSQTPVWNSMTDNTGLVGLWINSLAINPVTHDLYLATGMGRPGYGVGIIRLDQSGQYFTTSLTFDPGFGVPIIKKIIIDPSDPLKMFALTDNIIYSTVDGWTTFSSSGTPPPQTDFHFFDMQFDPNNSNTVLVTGYKFFQGAAVGGMIMRYNSGIWSDVSAGLPTSVSDNIMMDVSNGRFYIIYRDGAVEHMYYSTTSGLSWTFVRDIASQWISYNSEAHLVINHSDPNIIYAEGPIYPDAILYGTGRKVIMSRDGGITWDRVSSYNGVMNGIMTHADLRCFNIISGTSGHDLLYVGTDGGIMFSNNNVSASNFTWQDKNGTGLNISQFYALANAEKGPGLFITGAQDNGEFIYDNGLWSRGQGGDCYEGAIEGNNTLNRYIESSGGGPAYLYKSINGSAYSSTNPSIGLNTLGVFIDHDDNDKLYRFTKDIYNSNDKGVSWNPLSTFHLNSSDYNYCKTFRAVAVDPTDPNHIIACYNDPTWNHDLANCTNICSTTESCVDCNLNSTSCPLSHKFYVKRSGSPWVDETSHFDPNVTSGASDALRWQPITDLTFNPDNPQEMFATFGSYSWNSGLNIAENRVNISEDNGLTWKDYSEGLPPFAVNAIVPQKGSNRSVYIATDVGVYYRDRTLNTWVCYNDGLPTPLVMDIEIDYCRNKLLVVTYGRGAWEGNLVNTGVRLQNITENWNTPRNLVNDITITSGQTLNISAEINIARGRKILVEDGGILNTTNGAWLHNKCGEMWDGIYAQPNSIVTVQNSTIEDAYKAFNFDDNTTYQFVGNTFDKNFISLNFGNNLTQSTVQGDISGNTFKCSGNLHPYFGTPIPQTTPSTKSLCGIFSQKIDFLDVGTTGAVQNVFKEQVVGIMSFGTNIEVTNSRFEDIPRTGLYSSYGSHLFGGNTINGSGIFSQGNGNTHCNVRGNGLDFYNCFTGVSIYDQNFTIQQCHMDEMTCGVQINLCNSKRGMINQNYIASSDRGINLWMNDNSRTISIIENELYVGHASHLTTTQHPGAYGIGVFENHHTPALTTHISMLLNRIYVDYGLFGIIMISADHVSANGNIIELRQNNNNPDRPNEVVRGISINDCHDNYFYANSVTGTDDSRSSTQYGYDLNINSGMPNYLTCNSATKTMRNFYFGGGTNTTQIGGSDIGDGYEGLHVTTACYIGPQYHTGNCFGGTYGNTYAAVNNNPPGLILFNSAFTVQTGCYLPTNNQQIGDWFLPDNTQTEFDCNNIGCNPCDDNVLISIDEQIAMSNIGSGTYDDELKWEGAKYLYEKLTKYPSLKNSSALYQNFYSNYENSNIDKIVQLDFDLKSMNELPQANIVQYDNNEASIKNNVDQISQLSNLYKETSDASVQATISAQIQYLINQNRSLITFNNGIINTFLVARSTQADNFKTENETIFTSKDIEQNIKIVNEIYLSTIAKGILNFTDQQKTALQNISLQCPYAGGPGVYQARSLYNIIDNTVDFNDIENCTTLGYYRLAAKNQGNPEQSATGIIPNPVKDKAILFYNLSVDVKGTCFFYDNNGKKVRTLELEPNTKQIEFSTLLMNSSVYHYQIWSSNNLIGSGNFIVNK